MALRIPFTHVLYLGICNALRQHKTGGGPQPPPLNDVDKAILHILGDSPSFQGVAPASTDSKIEMTQTLRMSNVMAKRCNTAVLAETPSITKGINSGE